MEIQVCFQEAGHSGHGGVFTASLSAKSADMFHLHISKISDLERAGDMGAA